IISKLRDSGSGGVTSGKKVITVEGANENIRHSMNDDERSEFTSHINSVLAGDRHIGDRIPIPTHTMQVFDECRDGLLLCKLINDSVPDTIDERVLNVKNKLSNFQIIENNNVAINSAKAIGCSVINIGPQDIMDGREHLILGLIWQIIKAGLLSKIDIRLHPELYRLLEEDESLEKFLRLPPEQILLRWFNYHLKAAGWHRTVSNFSTDVKDGENYTILLNQLAPDLCSRGPLQERDLFSRAELVLQNAEKLNCRKYLSPQSMVAGNPKLNLAFVANLFNTHPGLDPVEEVERPELPDIEGDREARVFALWLNSLDLDTFVNNLYVDLQDGVVLLQAFDKMHPGIVDWKRASRRQPLNRFKQVENTNYAIMIGQHLRYTLVNMQGADIVDGSPTLTLGIVWQMMRENVTQTMKKLSKSGRDITDMEMIRWANEAVQRGGKTSKVSSFKDSSVDYAMVTRGTNQEDATMNAKYAISVARKIGAVIFVLPEDIIACRSKLILTFIGSLMAIDTAGRT
ncbi:Fimbrin, actin-bundling protein, partial [Lunasporangiospora selenospora]